MSTHISLLAVCDRIDEIGAFTELSTLALLGSDTRGKGAETVRQGVDLDVSIEHVYCAALLICSDGVFPLHY